MTEAHIYPGILIPPNERDLYNLWMEFIGLTTYSNTTGTAKGPHSPDASIFFNTNFSCNYEWRTNSSDIDVCELILKSGDKFFNRNFKNNGKPEYFSFGSAMPKGGYQIACGRWSDSKTIVGIKIPQRYEFTYFIPQDPKLSGQTSQAQYTCNSTVTNIYGDDMPAIPVGIEGGPAHSMVMVRDHRFMGKGYGTITYGVADGWSGSNDVQLLKMGEISHAMSFEDEMLKANGFKPSRKISRELLMKIAIIIILLLIPLHYMFKKDC